MSGPDASGPVVRGGGVELRIAPGRGARIVSLRTGSREWLVEDRTAPDRLGDAFVRPGLGGWDEVAPTVSAEVGDDGSAFADHGEAWSSPWSLAAEGDDRVVTTLALSSSPVDLERRATGSAAGVRLGYCALNRSSEYLPFLWSAHPLFAPRPGTILTLHDEEGQAGGFAADEEFPIRGAKRRLPAAIRFEDLARRGPVKLFAPAATAISAAWLRDPDGTALRMSWGGDPRLHLGLFADDGTLGGSPALAVEPCTGRSDSRRRAIAAAECLVLPPRAPTEWWIDLAA